MENVKVWSGACPECSGHVMWNGSKERGPHTCAECSTGKDFSLSKYDDYLAACRAWGE